ILKFRQIPLSIMFLEVSRFSHYLLLVFAPLTLFNVVCNFEVQLYYNRNNEKAQVSHFICDTFLPYIIYIIKQNAVWRNSKIHPVPCQTAKNGGKMVIIHVNHAA